MATNNYEKLTYDALLSNNISDFIFNYNMFILYNIKSKFNNLFKAYHLLIFLAKKNYFKFNLNQYRLTIEEIGSEPISYALELYLNLKMNLYKEVERLINSNKLKEFQSILDEIKNGMVIKDNIESRREEKSDILNDNILNTLNKL